MSHGEERGQKPDTFIRVGRLGCAPEDKNYELFGQLGWFRNLMM